MTPEKTRMVADVMNRFPEVTWDRCALTDKTAWVFGWIARDDSHEDFMLLEAESEDWEDGIRCGCSTSSALYSAEFSHRLNGEDAHHDDCQRVEHVFGDLVEKKIVLAVSA